MVQEIYSCNQPWMMHFPTKSTGDYAYFPNAFPSGFDKISVTLWIRVAADSFTDCVTQYGTECAYHTVWTYHRDGNANEEMEFSIYPDDFRFYMYTYKGYQT